VIWNCTSFGICSGHRSQARVVIRGRIKQPYAPSLTDEGILRQRMLILNWTFCGKELFLRIHPRPSVAIWKCYDFAGTRVCDGAFSCKETLWNARIDWKSMLFQGGFMYLSWGPFHARLLYPQSPWGGIVISFIWRQGMEWKKDLTSRIKHPGCTSFITSFILQSALPSVQSSGTFTGA